MSPFPIILSAPSGGGKTTIAKTLLSRRQDLGYSVSCTTRAPRATEVDGRDYYFNGRKHVRVGPPWRMWKETTTLYVTVHEGRSADGKIVGAGVLSLGVGALLSLLRAFRPTGCTSRWQRVKTTLAFFSFFAGQLTDHYLLGRRD